MYILPKKKNTAQSLNFEGTGFNFPYKIHWSRLGTQKRIKKQTRQENGRKKDTR